MKQLNSLSELPILSAIKDANSTYVNISSGIARLVGWKSVESCLGKTDYDIPSPVSEFADVFVNLDKKVVENNENLLTLDIQEYALGWKMLLFERIPFSRKNKESLEIFFTCVDVSNLPVFRSYAFLNQVSHRFKKKSFIPASYLLSESYCPLPLNERQQNILFFIMRGKSAKEIGKILNLSFRTIEFHLEKIKNKLGCHTKSQLIETAVNCGFLYYVPKNLQKNHLLISA